MDICTALILDAANAGRRANSIKPAAPNRIAPITLKLKCMTAARFAVLEPPTLDNSAVTQEPIFCPNVM